MSNRKQGKKKGYFDVGIFLSFHFLYLFGFLIKTMKWPKS